MDSAILNNNWYYWQSQYAGFFNNPDSISLDTYEKMALTDESIAYGLEYIALSILSLLGDYTHENPKINDYINRSVERMTGNFYFYVGEMLSARWAGFSVLENIWGLLDGKVTITELQAIHPSTITFELETAGPGKNRLKRVTQYRYSQNEVDIEPQNKRIVYTYTKRFGNPYGNSSLKSVYTNWFLKTKALLKWARATDKYAAPFPWIKAKDLTKSVALDGVTVTYRQYLEKVLQQIETMRGFITGDDTEITFSTPGADISNEFGSLIDYLNKMIFRGLLMPSLVGDAENASGSYALGQKHFDVFMLAVDKGFEDVRETLLEQFVRPIIEVNFGPQQSYGEFLRNEIKKDDIKILSSAYADLTNAGYISPENNDDLNEVRTRFGFSEAKAGDLPYLLQRSLDKEQQAINENMPAPADNTDDLEEATKADKPSLKEATLLGRVLV